MKQREVVTHQKHEQLELFDGRDYDVAKPEIDELDAKLNAFFGPPPEPQPELPWE